MNTSLGINFFRTVNEEGSNGWAQVYARIPFDDYELSEKGALFGVILGKPADNWTEIEGQSMEWVDEFFNKEEVGGGMADFVKNFGEKYPDIEGAWLWVTLNKNGQREIKTFRQGNAGVVLNRNDQEYDLTKEEGKIIKGIAEEKDIVVMWSGELEKALPEGERLSDSDKEKIAFFGTRLTEARVAGAGLFFNFEKATVVIAKEPRVTSIDEDGGLPDSLERKNIVNEGEDLAGEGLVGPLNAKGKVINWLKKRKFGRVSDLHIDREKNDKRKKWAVLFGVLFLILLVVSLISGSIKIKADREAKKWRDFSEPITKNIEDAQDLVRINPSGARKLMDDVRKTFDVQKAEFVNGKYKDEVIELEKKISKAWTVASGEKESQIDEVVNIQLVRPGFGGDRLSLVNGSMVTVLDIKLGIVVTAEVTSKDIKVVVGKGEDLGWIDAVSDGKKVFTLDEKGVFVDGKSSGGIVFDMAVGKPVAMGRFGTNIYILDSGNKEIYKYGGISDGFGDRIRWLQQGQSVSISPVDMAMDADVWLVSTNGVVERFRRGSREQFELSGVPEGAKVVRVAVEQEGSRIALLDSEKGVVIVCSKETSICGEQLISEKLKTARDIEFDGENNLLVLLPGVIGVMK